MNPKRRCKICHQWFQPRNMLARMCGPACKTKNHNNIQREWKRKALKDPGYRKAWNEYQAGYARDWRRANHNLALEIDREKSKRRRALRG